MRIGVLTTVFVSLSVGSTGCGGGRTHPPGQPIHVVAPTETSVEADTEPVTASSEELERSDP